MVVPDVLDLRLWHLLKCVLSFDVRLHGGVCLLHGERLFLGVDVWDVRRIQFLIDQFLPVEALEEGVGSDLEGVFFAGPDSSLGVSVKQLYVAK